jgi:hypothetical protein
MVKIPRLREEAVLRKNYHLSQDLAKRKLKKKIPEFCKLSQKRNTLKITQANLA